MQGTICFENLIKVTSIFCDVHIVLLYCSVTVTLLLILLTILTGNVRKSYGNTKKQRTKICLC